MKSCIGYDYELGVAPKMFIAGIGDEGAVKSVALFCTIIERAEETNFPEAVVLSYDDLRGNEIIGEDEKITRENSHFFIRYSLEWNNDRDPEYDENKGSASGIVFTSMYWDDETEEIFFEFNPMFFEKESPIDLRTMKWSKIEWMYDRYTEQDVKDEEEITDKFLRETGLADFSAYWGNDDYEEILRRKARMIF